MTTAIITRRIAIVTHVCIVCQEPANDLQGLVYEQGSYIHPNCSTRAYEICTEVSFPDDEPDPTTPAPAAALTGPELCNEWDSDYVPDWDLLFERYQAAKDYLLAA